MKQLSSCSTFLAHHLHSTAMALSCDRHPHHHPPLNSKYRNKNLKTNKNPSNTNWNMIHRNTFTFTLIQEEALSFSWQYITTCIKTIKIPWHDTPILSVMLYASLFIYLFIYFQRMHNMALRQTYLTCFCLILLPDIKLVVTGHVWW